MGWTSENVAEDFKIAREDMDRFAAMYANCHIYTTELLTGPAARINVLSGHRNKGCLHRKLFPLKVL
jgi:hypothetical protein